MSEEQKAQEFKHVCVAANPKCGTLAITAKACPYDEDVNGRKRPCLCCEACRRECAADV